MWTLYNSPECSHWMFASSHRSVALTSEHLDTPGLQLFITAAVLMFWENIKKKNQSDRGRTQPGLGIRPTILLWEKALPTQPLWCPQKDQGGLCVLLDRSFIMKQTQHWRPQVFWALSALLTAVNGPLPACCNIIYSPFHSCVSSAITFCKCTWATWCTHFWKDATLPPVHSKTCMYVSMYCN